MGLCQLCRSGSLSKRAVLCGRGRSCRPDPPPPRGSLKSTIKLNPKALRVGGHTLQCHSRRPHFHPLPEAVRRLRWLCAFPHPRPSLCLPSLGTLAGNTQLQASSGEGTGHQAARRVDSGGSCDQGQLGDRSHFSKCASVLLKTTGAARWISR